MKILFACGGTGGHINPALAIASYIKERHPQAEILFAGHPNGMEASLVPQAGFKFTGINIMGFQRKLTWVNVKYNLKSIRVFITSGIRSERLIKSFSPDIVIGTGGYVSGPLLKKAAQLKIKTVAHEQNAFPGATTRLLSRCVDKILLAYNEARDYLYPKCRTVLTGNPIREDIIFLSKEEARKELKISPDRVCVLSFGGSLGARRINEAVADLIKWHHKEGKIHHIHATGKYGVNLLPDLLKKNDVDISGLDYIDIREYITDMPKCMAAADLVLCRSGAITLSELAAAGKAAILIPSPNVSANHQYHNAMALSKVNAAIVIVESDLTGGLLCDTVDKLIKDRGRLRELGENAQKVAIIDANERIYKEIMELVKPHS